MVEFLGDGRLCELEEERKKEEDRDCMCKILLEILASWYSLIALGMMST